MWHNLVRKRVNSCAIFSFSAQFVTFLVSFQSALEINSAPNTHFKSNNMIYMLLSIIFAP